jgi:Zn-dependent protease with chaperone function
VHLILLLTALAIALLLRLIPLKREDNLAKRWQFCLFVGMFPPLILIMTALAVIFMGYNGKMLGFPASRFSYLISLVFIIFSVICLLKLSYQAWLSLQKIRSYPLTLVRGKPARVLDISFPYIGQIGFWKPELVITTELITILSPQHLQAVMAHEEAHYDHRDTFWFFWLGLLKNITYWLPNTEKLWEELLLLRELRADQKASEKVDFLLLAESLLLVTQASVDSSSNFNESFSCAFSDNRLTERVNALLNPVKSHDSLNIYLWSWLLLSFLPWFTLPLHY